MKILITGANGQLGKQLENIILKGKSELGFIPDELKGAKVISFSHNELDITDLNLVRKCLHSEKPYAVINCAAMTNVDGCEEKCDLAYKINSLGARNLAMVCDEISAKLVQVSTDYVFDGTDSVPMTEYNITNPVSTYGKTKLEGEKFVREFSSKYFIVRTSWLYGYQGKNFVYTIMDLAKKRDEIKVVNDQRGNPTNAEDLAFHILKLILTEEYGVYHCTGDGECSWYDFAKKIVEYSNIDCRVNPCTSDEYKRLAKRPTYSSLDNMMLRLTVKDEMRNWEDALKEFIKNINK